MIQDQPRHLGIDSTHFLKTTNIKMASTFPYGKNYIYLTTVRRRVPMELKRPDAAVALFQIVNDLVAIVSLTDQIRTLAARLKCQCLSDSLYGSPRSFHIPAVLSDVNKTRCSTTSVIGAGIEPTVRAYSHFRETLTGKGSTSYLAEPV